jgi:hypothetical protein
MNHQIYACRQSHIESLSGKQNLPIISHKHVIPKMELQDLVKKTKNKPKTSSKIEVLLGGIFNKLLFTVQI